MAETAHETVSNSVTEVEKTPSELFFNRSVGLTEAVNITGRNKGQISKDTNGKRLPYTRNEQGHKRYQVSDLYHLYGFKKPKETPAETGSQGAEKPSQETPETASELETAIELAVLKERLQAQAELLRRAEDDKRRAEEEIRDLRQSRDRLIENTNRLTFLLAGPANPPEPPEKTSEKTPDEPAPKPRPWYKRLFQ
jgi:hypothetical protein